MTTTPQLKEEKPELCGKSVYWWEGEYDGNCELPKNHLEPFHYDGISYYDDDMNNRDYEQENLEKLITAQVRAARIEEVRKARGAAHIMMDYTKPRLRLDMLPDDEHFKVLATPIEYANDRLKQLRGEQ